MGPFDRGLTALYSLVVSAFAVAALLELFGYLPPMDGLHALPAKSRDAVAAGLGVLLLVGLRLLWAGVRRSHRERQAVVEDNSLGQVRVALTAIENLINKVVSQVPGVRDVHSRVVGDPNGIAIRIKATVTPEINIPEISKEIQQQVQDRVKDVTGINTASVRILINNIATVKPRVE
ncbi:MAG: alkaline shock response membrane anchor protein AmaP [Thermoanaerobacterales bacterium]|nr:alkaline shock response membrane anchor protein AmaP [Bacillota bacterium]MDI6906768.1 alkaline shock response membrane anchor protein AmaP [Thermoanaerobacterales bacterium]